MQNIEVEGITYGEIFTPQVMQRIEFVRRNFRSGNVNKIANEILKSAEKPMNKKDVLDHRRNDLAIVCRGCRPCPLTLGKQFKRSATNIKRDCGPTGEGVAAGKGNLTTGARARAVKYHQQCLTTVHRNNTPIARVYGLLGR